MTNIRMNSKKIWLDQTFNMSRKYFFIVTILLMLAPKPIPQPLHIHSIRFFRQYCLSFPSTSIVNSQREGNHCINFNIWAPRSSTKTIPAPTALFTRFGMLIPVSIILGTHILLLPYLWPLSFAMIYVNGYSRSRSVMRDSSADPRFFGWY